MTPKAKAQPQPDSSGIIPFFFLLYFASLTLYGILRIGAGCCEVLFGK